MANNPHAARNLKPFAKGKDPRRNVAGRPPKAENLEELRKLLLDFLNTPVTRNKTRFTRAFEKLMHTSTGIAIALQYSVGKVPDKYEGTIGPSGDFIEHLNQMAEKIYGKAVREKAEKEKSDEETAA